MWRWLCCCAGTVAIVAWALSPSRRWRHRSCRDGHCHRLGAGALAVVMMAPCRRHSSVVIAGSIGACVTVGIVTMASSLPLPWCSRHHHGAITSVTFKPSPSLRWRHQRAGPVAIIVSALSTSRCWRPCNCHDVHRRCHSAGAIAAFMMAPLLPTRQSHHRRR